MLLRMGSHEAIRAKTCSIGGSLLSLSAAPVIEIGTQLDFKADAIFADDGMRFVSCNG
jgi:hypothetical protein